MGVIKRSKFQPLSPVDAVLNFPEGEAVPDALHGSLEALRIETPVEAPTPPPVRLSRYSHLNRSVENRDNLRQRSSRKEEKLPKGQKKRRRYENNKYLVNLAKNEDGTREEPCFNEPHSLFATLLQESDKMAAWNSFLALSDDDQMAVIESNEIFAFFSEEPILEEAPLAVVEKLVSHRDRRRAMTPDQAFRTLGTKLRSVFTKRHFPMGILEQLENEVVDFFLETPKGTCVIERSCSFDRLILHAVTRFNFLVSQSFSTDDDRRETHIRNICPEFIPPPVSLSEYVQNKRRRR